MQKTILLIAVIFTILSCGDRTQKQESAQNSNQKKSILEDQSKIGRLNYAVIWTTPNAQLISKYSGSITSEFTELWKEDIIENAYFNTESTEGEVDQFPDIAFFLKAHSKQEAQSILKDLTIVKKEIGFYQLHSVGTLWLNRKTEVINEKGKTKSFVTVWKTSNKNKTEEILKDQNEEILKLWNSGTIENVYFDIEGTQKTNDKTDFVLFVNSDTRKEADSICKTLPFFKEGIATYNIYPVGIFWFGKYEDQ